MDSMVEVAIVGGGTTGQEAAAAATARGATVTVFEKSEDPLPRWDSWIDLIARARRTLSTTRRVRNSGCSIVRSEVKAVRRGQLSTSTGEFRTDMVVLAAGSRPGPVSLEGREKTGITVLDGPSKYARVGSMATSTERAVVCGEGERALQVADRLSTRGVKVKLIVSSWKNGRPSPQVGAVIRRAARDFGVTILEGKPERALGVGKLEALAFEIGIIRCDNLVLVPCHLPALPTTEALLGMGGGVLVDRFLRTNVAEIFAAGASAEVQGGLPPHGSLSGESRTSGRVAGVNAVCGASQIQRARLSEVIVFGLRWSRAGAVIIGRDSTPPNLGIASQSRESSACTLVFQKKRRRVVGIETIGDVEERPGNIVSLVSQGRPMESLAYSDSTDITLVSETAQLGLGPWSES